MLVVAATSTVIAAIFITLSVLGSRSSSFMMSIFGAGITVILIIVYLVGAAKLTKAVGDENESGLRVVKLTRQVAVVMIINLLTQGCYAIIGSHNAFMPLQIILTNLLIPIAMIAAMLLLLRFIRSSFERQLHNKGARTRGHGGATRSTASVSPATDFTSSMTSVSQTGSAVSTV